MQDYLKDENIENAPRNKNPANVPELGPIEDFWTEIKRFVYADNWQAENLRQLRNQIEYCMKKIRQNHGLGGVLSQEITVFAEMELKINNFYFIL